MLSEILSVITQVGMLLFVVGGMAAMGLGLTISRIATPLRDVRMVLLLLLVNFVVVPAAAIAAARLRPMDQDAATAVVLIGCTRRGGLDFGAARDVDVDHHDARRRPGQMGRAPGVRGP
jgi:predicted Na+-dependent transporter